MATLNTDRLVSLLSSVKSAGDPDVTIVLKKLEEEARERRGRGAGCSMDFFSTTFQAVSRLRGKSNAALRLSCLFECAYYFFLKGQTRPSIAAIREVLALAHSVDDSSWKVKANTMAGIIYADAGHTSEAFLNYAAALQGCRQQGDITAEAKSIINLGVALNYGGLYREAIPCFQWAACLADSTEMPNELHATAAANLAQSHFYLEDFENGLSAIRRSLQFSKTPSDAGSGMARTIREFTFVQIALELRQYDLAIEHNQLCSRFSTLAGSGPSEVMAIIANGLCEVHTGDVAKGLAMLESTLTMFGDSESIRSDALISLAKAYDHARQPDRALLHLQTLMRHIRARQERSLGSLLSMPFPLMLDGSWVGGAIDLRVFELREAKLQTEVAVRETMASRIEMVERLAITADLKEEESGQHGYRVGRLSSLLARELGWEQEQTASIDLAARLHDIGKISIPDRIVFNSEALNGAERDFMNLHTVIGAELLAMSDVPQLHMAEEIALHHHEWWNGTGYPDKLAGKRIPIHARIVALADVFDALTHGRPFAQPWPVERALHEIQELRGRQFDPDLTDCFVNLVERLQAEHPDLDAYLGKAGRNSPFLQARNRIRTLIAGERHLDQDTGFGANETRH